MKRTVLEEKFNFTTSTISPNRFFRDRPVWRCNRTVRFRRVRLFRLHLRSRPSLRRTSKSLFRIWRRARTPTSPQLQRRHWMMSRRVSGWAALAWRCCQWGRLKRWQRLRTIRKASWKERTGHLQEHLEFVFKKLMFFNQRFSTSRTRAALGGKQNVKFLRMRNEYTHPYKFYW